MPSETLRELSSTKTSRLPSEARLAQLAAILLFFGIALVLALPLVSRLPWMIFVQDDFFYYLKVAQNIAQGHGSTFNSLVATNGYQPLWLVVLTGLSYCTTNARVIFAWIGVANFAAALSTFLLARRLVRSSGVRPLLVFALSAVVTLYSVTLFFYGMEVTLALPLMLGVICVLLEVSWLVKSALHTFVLGLLLSLMVLARIDSLIFGGMILAGILVHPALRRLIRPRLVLGALLGLLPVAGYLLGNHLVFHTWLPVSGSAKQLRLTYTPSLEPWRVFFHPLAAGYACLLLLAGCVFFRVKSRLSDMARVVFPSVLLFPFVYYGILCCLSDWTLWGWYMYPLRSAVCVSFVILCLFPPIRRLLEQPVALGLLLAALFGSVCLLRWTRQQTDIYAASLEIQTFAETHPGIYAMGDRAGRVGYLLHDPVVQTEGLMMDRSYLDFVRHQTPLRQTLAAYHVRYYVGTAYTPFTGCFHAAEPAKSGPTSARMRADFCEPPVATYTHDGIETLIYDLQPSPR